MKKVPIMGRVRGLRSFDAAMKKLGEKYGVELPLTNAVYELCYGEEDCTYRQRCDKLMQRLFARETKTEF